MNKLYVAYGSNLNIDQMAIRCPNAKVYGKGRINDHKLAFRLHATILEAKGESVPVAVWEINETDEKNLDRYEGYPRYYRKEQIKVEMSNNEEIEAMVYIMNGGRKMLPTRGYAETILKGYRDIGLDESYLVKAINEIIEEMGA